MKLSLLPFNVDLGKKVFLVLLLFRVLVFLTGSRHQRIKNSLKNPIISIRIDGVFEQNKYFEIMISQRNRNFEGFHPKKIVKNRQDRNFLCKRHLPIFFRML